MSSASRSDFLLVPIHDENVPFIANESLHYKDEYSNQGMPALHQAAMEGDIVKLQNELLNIESGDEIQRLHDGRTVLHYAAEYPKKQKATEMMEQVLNCNFLRTGGCKERRKLIDKQLQLNKDNNNKLDSKNNSNNKSRGRDGDTALHIAARNYNRKGVMQLLSRRANANIVNGLGEQPIDIIHKNVPNAMIALFDQGLELREAESLSPDEEDLEILVDFSYVVGKAVKGASYLRNETNMIKPAACTHTGWWFNQQHNSKENSEILLHPLVEIFLHYKWEAIKPYIWFSIGYHIFWSLCSAAFFVSLYGRDCAYNCSVPNPDISVASCIPGTFTLVLSGILLLISIPIALKEIYEMKQTCPWWKYISKQNLGQLLLIISILNTVILRSYTTIRARYNIEAKRDLPYYLQVAEWEYPLAAVSLFAGLAFALILAQLGKLPTLGIYMNMLHKVTEGSFYFMGVFCCLLAAFWASFEILLPNRDEFKWFGFVKMPTLLIGEANYDDLFFGEDSHLRVPFPITTQLTFLAAILIVTVVMANLLIGILVSDIMALREEGHLSSIKTQLREINLMETFLLSTAVRAIIPESMLRKIPITKRGDNKQDCNGNAKVEAGVKCGVQEVQINWRNSATLPSSFSIDKTSTGINRQKPDSRRAIYMNDESIPLELRHSIRRKIAELYFSG